MKCKCLLFILICFIIILCNPIGAQANAISNEIGEAAVAFLGSLAEGGWSRAPRFCIDPVEVKNWSPPFVTKYIVFPSIMDIGVTDVKIDRDTAIVTLSMTAIDFDALTDSGWSLRDELLFEMNLQYEYATEEAIYDESKMWLIHDSAEFMAEAENHRKRYEISYFMRQAGEEWKVDLAATLVYWQAGSLTVSPISYGVLSYDYAQKRYYAIMAFYDDRLSIPDDMSWDQWLRAITTDEIFSALKTPVWNIWLRLRAEGEAEGLYDFKVDTDTADCAKLLVEYPKYNNIQAEQNWISIGNEQHAILEMNIPIDNYEPLDGYSVQCRRRSNIWNPQYFEEELNFSLDSVPYNPGYPEGGISFTVDHFMRVGTKNYIGSDGNDTADTLGELMEYESDYEYAYNSVFLNTPEEIAGLPIINDKYALFRLEGTSTKVSGYLGVYDVTFGLETPVDGVWIEAYEQCPSCDVIDIFDLLGKESTLMETLQRSFDIQVLIRVDGRTDEELEMLIKTLKFAATFSAEEWDFSYEEHGTTTRIGPRSTLPINTSGMILWTGTLDELPRAEWR